MRSPSNNHAGNILFLILLAIVLFAALTVAVNGGFRVSQDQNIPKEKARSIASQIINYTTLMEQSVTRMRITGGCTIEQLDFDRAPDFTGYDGLNTPADGRCKLFDTNGGGVPFVKPDPTWFDGVNNGQYWYGEYFFNGANYVTNIGTTAAGVDTSAELTVLLLYLKKDICVALNDLLNIKPSDPPPSEGSSIAAGQFSRWGEPNIHRFGSSPTRLWDNNPEARTSGCLTMTSSPVPGAYFFFHTLVVR